MQIIYSLALFLMGLQQLCGSDVEPTLEKWERQKSYYSSAQGGRLTNADLLNRLSDSKAYKATNDQDLINRYINTLYFSTQGLESCGIYSDASERIRYYKDKIKINNQDSRALTALALLTKMAGQEKEFIQLLIDKNKLSKTINYYYGLWEKDWLPKIKTVKSELGKVLLTYANPFSIRQPITLLEVQTSDIPCFANTPTTITIAFNNLLSIEEENDGETIRVVDFKSESDLVKILEECKEDKNLHSLYIEPKKSFAVDGGVERFWKRLNKDESPNITTLHIPYDCSGFNEFKNALLDRNCLDKLLSGSHFALYFMHLNPFPEQASATEALREIEEIINGRLN